MYLKEQIIRILGAAIGATSIFLLLPAIQFLIKDDLNKDSSISKSTQILMNVQKEKPKQKKEPPKQLRKIQTRSRSLRSNTTNFKFAPDLGVEGDQAVTMNNDKVDAQVFDEGEMDEPPKPVSTPAPTYPIKARTQGIEGVVEISFIVDSRGRVPKVTIKQIPHEMFRENVLNTVRSWRFKPGKMKGVAVNCRVTRRLNFRLGT